MSIRRPLALALFAALVLVGCAHGPTRFPLYPAGGDQFTLAPPQRPPTGPISGATDRERFDALVADWRERLRAGGAPGGAIAVVLDGKLAFAAGVGVTAPGGDTPVTADTRFRLASDTKALIAAAVLREVDDGKLALDRPLGAYLPWLTGPLAQATPAMLLDHTSGLWRGGEDDDCPRGPDGVKLYFTAHARDPLWAPPGRLYSYSNVGFALAAELVAELEHRPFEEVVTERVLRPVGMTGATFDPAAAGEHATGLALETSATVPLTDRDCPLFRGAGGVIASATEEAHFLEALLGGGADVLSPASLDAMLADHVATGGTADEHYAFGFGASTYKGLRMLSHAGRSSGYGAFVAMIPARKLAVVALVNANRAPAGVVVRAIDALLGLPPGMPARALPPPATWDRYVGTYVDPSGGLGTVTVARDGDHLALVLASGRALSVETDITFVPGADGRAEYLVSPLGVARRR